jgi:hypothetical protein
MIAILADHRVDHDLVSGQALLDGFVGAAEPRPQRKRYGLDNCYDQKTSLKRFMTVLRHTYVI